MLKIKGCMKKVVEEEIEKQIDRGTFESILRGDKVEYNKFSKLKEAIRSDRLPNQIIRTFKKFSLDDSKRSWFTEYDIAGTQESEPLEV